MKLFDTDQHLNDQEIDLIKSAGLTRKRVMPTDGWHREQSSIPESVRLLLQDRKAYFERFDIGHAVLFPTRSLSHAMIMEPEISLRILEAYNSYALHAARELEGMLLPIALAAVHDVGYTVSRLPYYKEAGFHGILLLPHGHGKLFGHREFVELYAACQDLELPITLHPNSAGGVGQENCTSFEEFHTLTFPFTVIKQFVNMMFSGVFERFPKLSFLILEAGAGWLPFWIDRMDNEFQMRHREVRIRSTPSQILREARVYVSYTDFDRDLATVNAMLGGGVVWGSDYPHWDAQIPDSRAALLGGCPEAIREQVFCANGNRCFYLANDQRLPQ
jgi:uncharacterized protein